VKSGTSGEAQLKRDAARFRLSMRELYASGRNIGRENESQEWNNLQISRQEGFVSPARYE
jgi:hypothetical protein